MRTTTRLLSIAMVASILIPAQVVHSAPLNPTGWTAAADSHYPYGDPGPRLPILAFDGSGLTAGTDTILGTSDVLHTGVTGNPTYSWMTQFDSGSPYAGGEHWLMVNMQSTQSIGQIEIWNYYENSWGQGGRGGFDVDIYYATAASSPVLPTEFFGDGNGGDFNNFSGWTFLMNADLTMAGANPTVRTDLLNPADFQAQYVIFNFNTNHGDGGGLGIGEIRFLEAEAPAVPEPSTLVLATLGLAGLGLFAWRRRNLANEAARV